MRFLRYKVRYSSGEVHDFDFPATPENLLMTYISFGLDSNAIKISVTVTGLGYYVPLEFPFAGSAVFGSELVDFINNQCETPLELAIKQDDDFLEIRDMLLEPTAIKDLYMFGETEIIN